MAYFQTTETLKREVELAITQIEGKDEYAKENYPVLLANLYNMRRMANYYNNVHKFFKVDKNTFLRIIGDTAAQGNSLQHIVKDYETPITIANKYSVTPEEVVDTNGKIASDIKTGDVLEIKVNEPLAVAINENVPTYGDQRGAKLYGNDLSNELIQGGQGDLLILNEADTLRQGISNRVTTKKGGYPMATDFGLNSLKGLQLPFDLEESLYKVKIAETIEADPRISEIKSIDSSRQGNSVTYEIEAMTINNEFITIN